MPALEYLRQYARVRPAEEAQAADTVSPPVAPGMPHDIDRILAGQYQVIAAGGCLIVDRVFPAEHRHGRHAFQRLAAVTGSGLAAISRDPELSYADLRHAVFLDTETTGLNLGTGTYVFLVGAGFFTGDTFVVRQFFLRSPGEEEPYLAALDAFLRRFSVLVTFNGKAFDWPLLESRFVAHRQFRCAPLDDPPHVDLLHPARRLWRRRLTSCALSSLERSILGVERSEEDVPGWLIPSLYFAYVRSGDGRRLAGVFYHNLQDILSLATLTVHMHAVLADPLGGLVEYGADFIALARSFSRDGDIDGAVMCLEEALRLPLEPADRCDALQSLALLHKRERRWEAALPLLDRLVDEGGEVALRALVERAKYYEHVERSYLEALDDVQHALNLLELGGLPLGESDRIELERRRGRLVDRSLRDRSWSRRR